MSRATAQTTALLALTASALAHIKATPDTEHTLEYAWEMTGIAVEDFPVPRNIRVERRQAKAWLDEWNVSGATMVNWSQFTLASIAFEIVEDLLSAIRDPRKREVLEPLQEALQALCATYADADRAERERYLEARRMVGEMYRIMEFS